MVFSIRHYKILILVLSNEFYNMNNRKIYFFKESLKFWTQQLRFIYPTSLIRTKVGFSFLFFIDSTVLSRVSPLSLFFVFVSSCTSVFLSSRHDSLEHTVVHCWYFWFVFEILRLSRSKSQYLLFRSQQK